MRDEPKRWSAAGSEAPAALRDLLAAGREQVGGSGEIESLRQRLAQVLPPEAGLGDAPLPRPSSGALPRPSRLGWIAGGVGAAAVLWLALRTPAREEAQPAPAPSVTAPSEPPSADTATAHEDRATTGDTAPVAPAETPVDGAGEAQPAPAELEPARVKAPQRATKPRSAAKPDEAELLRRAQAALAARPAEALALTREHERHFARGALREEREVLAIEALRKLGKSDAAAERAARFEQSYPRSVHLEKVRGR